MLRGRFVAVQPYIRKQEKHQINNLALHLKQQEKEEQNPPRFSRGKEIIKIRADILRTGKDRGQEEKGASWIQ